MKRNILRILSLVLALLAISATFFACGQNGGSGEGSNAIVELQSNDAPVDQLDWGGRPFRVLATHNAYQPNFEIIGEIGTDRLSQAVYERNLAIKEFCNVEIYDVTTTNDGNLSALEKDVMSGTQSYDLVFLIRDEMATAIQQGYMKDINTVEYVNLENEWYNPLAIETMQVSGKLYHLSSSFSLTDKARTATLYFNRDMAETFKLGIDVIEEVRAGTWTIDKMNQMVAMIAASGDINGDNLIQPYDRFGVVGGGDECATAFYTGMGNTLVDIKDPEGAYGQDILEDRSLNGMDIIKSLFDVRARNGFTGTEGTYWKQDYELPYDTFIDGRALFYAGTMGIIDSLAKEAEFAYTAITYPKYDEDQERYYTTNDNYYASTFGIPCTAFDFNFSGYMIEVLSWKSHTTTYPEYYQVKCLVRNSYDPVCAEMLQLNCESLVFDFGLMFSKTVKYKHVIVTYTTSAKNNKNVATLFEENDGLSQLAIQGILDAIELLTE